MIITIIRHAETKANQKRAFSGQKEIELSLYGEEQVKMLFNYIKHEKFDAIYCSPLSRAIKTIEPIAKNLNIPIIKENGLIEMGYGDVEGVAREELKDKFPETWEFFKKYDYFKGAPNQEKAEDAINRFGQTLISIVKNNPDKKNILCGTHGMILRLFLASIQGIDLLEVHKEPRIKNASITKIDYDIEKNVFTLLSMNNVEHEEIL